MTTTTLITFLVRAPVSTRSVGLLGSWDNFTTTYAMQRDPRTGPEHWSGCHTFSNIICDGNLRSTSRTRDGGLKMGGTYWYYYKLDDDIEFHNSAEPSTAACPMLPGQLVNVLHVPIALSGSRIRSASTSSDCRTLNPSDKYLNPRPVPRPRLHRLKTSPTPPQQPWPSDPALSGLCVELERSQSAGQNSISSTQTTAFRFLRPQWKQTLDSSYETASPGATKTTAFRNPFRLFTRTPRSTSPEGIHDPNATHVTCGSQPDLSEDSLNDHAHGVPSTSGITTPASVERADTSPSELERALQALTESGDSSETFAALSFYRHHGRVSRSRSRDPSPLRTSSLLDEQHQAAVAVPLETLAEVQTPAVPDMPMELPSEGPRFYGKRLPTLPHTPSSAYPPSPANDTDEFPEMEPRPQQSHFSNSTIASDIQSQDFHGNTSRFSAWTDDSTSICASGSPDDELPAMGSPDDSPLEGRLCDNETSDALSGEPHVQGIAIVNSYGAVPKVILPIYSNSITDTSTTSQSPTSSLYEFPDLPSTRNVSRASERGISWNKFEHYSLPPDDYVSEITLKQAASPNGARTSFYDDRNPEQPLASVDDGPREVSHSESMQQLLEELSYLTDMIQR